MSQQGFYQYHQHADDSEISQNCGEIRLLEHPKASHQIEVCHGFSVQLTDQYKYPNAFHRLMQRLAFGFKYKKL